MVPTCGAGVTAAAGTGLAHHLFAKVFALDKSPGAMPEHSEFPRHTFVHCEVFPTAAPRGAGTNISVSLSGHPLSRPVRIFGLVVHYTANDLIRRRPIFRRCLWGMVHSSIRARSGLILSFPRLFRT